MDNHNSTQLVTPGEAARLLAISIRTLYTQSSQRKIPSVKVGRCLRFRRIDLEKIINNGFRPALGEVSEPSKWDLSKKGGAA